MLQMLRLEKFPPGFVATQEKANRPAVVSLTHFLSFLSFSLSLSCSLSLSLSLYIYIYTYVYIYIYIYVCIHMSVSLSFLVTPSLRGSPSGCGLLSVCNPKPETRNPKPLNPATNLPIKGTHQQLANTPPPPRIEEHEIGSRLCPPSPQHNGPQVICLCDWS